MPSEKTRDFCKGVKESLSGDTFVKLSLGNYKGTDETLKNILVKKTLVKKEEKLSFTYRHKTRDIVKNYAVNEGLSLLQKSMEDGFLSATLFTTDFDLLYDKKRGLVKNKPTQTALPSLEHNRRKNRLIAPKNNYLHALNITDASGNVLSHAQDKYRQINKYVEILSGLIKNIPPERLKKITDMGAGKGYLTFALYDYLRNTLKLDIQVTGVEHRADLVDLCSRAAGESGFSSLRFEQGMIEQYDATGTDILIALHACDTATDDAIYKGIEAGAELIVVAPCCHKQIRRELEKADPPGEMTFIMKHGIFMERQAEMVTDGMRAMILEYFGYTAKVFEFISDAHTAKNVLIVGTRNKNAPASNKALLEKIKKTKEWLGIGYHHLERRTGIEK